jgi:hypothetical protein
MPPKALASSSLDDLAKRISAKHQQIINGMIDVVRNAIFAGEDLTRAKLSLDHGDWEAYVTNNCGLSTRTAQVYMKVAREKDQLKEHLKPGLSLNKALGYLKASKRNATTTTDTSANTNGSGDNVATSLPESTQQSDGFDKLEDRVVETLKALQDKERAKHYASGLVRRLRDADLIN